ncbi:sodium channel subunit beta-3-like isoform X1 [Carassius auratus]|uniref:Sodium channel regulatory subunit beta-3 n=1 Tax=Carassius auratus TaxID=7957 RepID=A0A6P6LEX3_CARAU|nr:sodium channel subunit beta-3-like isoform X1 [Carassius auratus]XP_026082113.1 sodium channel subunit beta-3-like isoform X1 [Carassius auratus]XP_052471754.1 sodium channel subunit beta-3-like isoform X1 [Carassius gibelio]XP_052471755.1 sodium channel subunit beta-3-like isoform X1 [Carassius gibelio]
MASHMRLVLHFLLLFIFAVQEVRLVCVEVASDTEAIIGRVMKLTCSYCMKREEIPAETKVDWFFTGEDKRKVLIYQYDREPQEPKDVEMYWKGRLTWNGSKDLQDVSISILNVTLKDSGTYECEVSRFFEFDSYKHSTTKKTTINLRVKMKASEDTAALYSEIMMYVLLVFLTFWLLMEMIYCYRKISKSEEQMQDTATDYLAIPSENKENPDPAVTE